MKRLLLGAVLLALAVDGVLVARAPAADPPPAHVPPGVTVNGVELGGLASERARDRVRASFRRPLLIVHGREAWHAWPTQLGARASVDDAVARVLAASPGERLQLRVAPSTASIRRYVRLLQRRFGRPAENAELVGLVNLAPSVRPAKTGLAVRQDEMTERLVTALRTGSREPLALLTEPVEPEVTSATLGPVVVIRRASNKLYLYDGSRHVRTIEVATGQARYPTPLGRWSVVDKQRNPWWRPPDSEWAKGLKPVPPGPGNPLGTRWMGMSAPGVGMHGTPDAASIGYSRSHGCIRMRIPDAEWLFERVELGTPVFVVDA